MWNSISSVVCLAGVTPGGCFLYKPYRRYINWGSNLRGTPLKIKLSKGWCHIDPTLSNAINHTPLAVPLPPGYDCAALYNHPLSITRFHRCLTFCNQRASLIPMPIWPLAVRTWWPLGPGNPGWLFGERHTSAQRNETSSTSPSTLHWQTMMIHQWFLIMNVFVWCLVTNGIANVLNVIPLARKYFTVRSLGQ